MNTRWLINSAGFQVRLFASTQEFLDYGPVELDAMMILDVFMLEAQWPKFDKKFDRIW